MFSWLYEQIYKVIAPAEQKYGFRIYQGGVVPVKSDRIVSIEDFDVEACGGTHVKKTKEIRDYLAQKLEHDFNAEISGHRKHRIANNVHTIFPGLDNERALFALDELGVDVAAGSACSASSDVSSHVLLAIGKSDVQAQASIRFSLGQYTRKDEIARLLELLPKALQA